jgi:deoxyribodipyrimidine photo-lyase
MQKKQENTGLIWFRNNLRVSDNASLKRATENHTKVVAVYFLIQSYLQQTNLDFKKQQSIGQSFL